MSNRRDALSVHCKIRIGTTVFFIPHEARTGLIEGKKALHAMTKVGKWCI